MRYRPVKTYPEPTVEQCLCVSGHERVDCHYTDKPYEPKMEYVNGYPHWWDNKHGDK